MAYFFINDVPLIKQDKDMSCWYAAAQMIISWRRERKKMCEPDYRDPSECQELSEIYLKNKGLPFNKNLFLANKLGFQSLPPITPSKEFIQSILMNHGPILFSMYNKAANAAHDVVITGICDQYIAINNPNGSYGKIFFDIKEMKKSLNSSNYDIYSVFNPLEGDSWQEKLQNFYTHEKYIIHPSMLYLR